MASFGTPFLTPQIPPEVSLCGSLFGRSLPGNEAHKLFSGGPIGGGLGEGQKAYAEKFMCFFRPFIVGCCAQADWRWPASNSQVRRLPAEPV